MNSMSRLRAAILARFPAIAAEIDAPGSPSGRWFLDVRPGGDARPIVVEWQLDSGFGVSTPDEDDYGTKADEIYLDVNSAFQRIVQLVTTGATTEPPTAAQLAE